jgi:hypothetical protein
VVETLEDRAHFLGVSLLFLEFKILLIVSNILGHSVLELVGVLSTFDITVCHYSHDLLIVVQN